MAEDSRQGESGGQTGNPVAVPGPTLPVAEFSDNFDSPELDMKKWLITRKNDFSEFAVDTVPVNTREEERQLQLRCGTRGTDDATVKFLGVVSRTLFDLTGTRRLALDFDWNNQSNGCYMTGAVYLCPTLTTSNPADEAQWIRLEYVGVPPGKNVRAAIWLTSGGNQRWLHDEGWPKEQRTGRPIARVSIEILLDKGVWKIFEDGQLLFDSGEEWKLPFNKAYLYLQMSSHSNYPSRRIFFDNVTFTPYP